MNAFEKEIRERFSSKVEERGCFLVDVEVSADNDATIVIEAMDRNVDLEDCVSLDKSFHEMWDQDAADYSLTVTSAGLDLPFKDLRQYLKAKGEKVEVRFRGGRSMTAELLDADEEGMFLRYSVMEVPQGKKKKVAVVHEDRFPFSEINSVRPHVSFDK